MKILARTEAKGDGYSINLIIKLTAKNKMGLQCSKKEKLFKFFYSEV